MTNQTNEFPEIKSKDLRKLQLNFYLELVSKNINSHDWTAFDEWDNFNDFEEYCYQRAGESFDHEFIKLYGKQNFIKLNRRTHGRYSKMEKQFYRWVKKPLFKIRSELKITPNGFPY